jgi:WD40 repeat protein
MGPKLCAFFFAHVYAERARHRANGPELTDKVHTPYPSFQEQPMRRRFALLFHALVICGGAALCVLAQRTAARGDLLDDPEKPVDAKKDSRSDQAKPPAARSERYKLTLVKWTDKQVASISRFGGGGTVYSVGVSPNGKHVLLGGDVTVPLTMLWNIETGEMERYFDVFEPRLDGAPVRVAVCPDGKKAAMGTLGRAPTIGNKLFLVELEHSNVLHVIDRYAFAVSLAYSPDGKQLALSQITGDLIFLDANSGEESFRLPGHRAGSVICFSPDGKRLASASLDQTARIWDLAARKQLHLLQHEAWVWSVAFSPDGKFIATGTGGPIDGDPFSQRYVQGPENKIRVWDASTGKLLKTLSGHTDRIQGIEFVQDGKRLVSGSYDGSLRLWDLATGKELARDQGKCAIFCVAIAGKNDTIIAGGGSTRVGESRQKPFGEWKHAPEERVRVFKIETVK